MTEWAIDAQNLVKKFFRRVPANNGEKQAGKRSWNPFQRPPQSWFIAVNGVSLQIEKGEIFGLLGPNGAGKSTTIRILCTLLEPTSGTALVNGYDICKQANNVRQSLGTVLTGERSIYWKLTARENLEYFAALYHLPPTIAKKRVQELLGRMELSDRADELVEKYSSGMKQRVAISKALLARPPIVLLDEPTIGLDPQAARRVRELISELKDEGHTVLLTTHYMEEADQLSDRIGIIDNGKIIALDTPANLKKKINQKDVIKLEVSGWYPEMAAGIQSLPGIENLVYRHMGVDTTWEIGLHVSDSRSLLPSLLECVNTGSARLVNMKVVEPTLEDVFISLTGKALRD